MREVRVGGQVRVLTSGRATQLVLFSHGGYEESVKWRPSIFGGRWKTRNTKGFGFVQTPYKINFYTRHGDFTSASGSFLEAIHYAGAWRLRNGSIGQVIATGQQDRQALINAGQVDIALLAMKGGPKGSPKTIEAVVPAGADVWDYSLSAFNPNKPADVDNIEKIEWFRTGNFPADVDLVYINSGSVHLGEVLRTCQLLDPCRMQGGRYDLVHYLPCRHAGALNDKYRG